MHSQIFQLESDKKNLSYHLDELYIVNAIPDCDYATRITDKSTANKCWEHLLKYSNEALRMVNGRLEVIKKDNYLTSQHEKFSSLLTQLTANNTYENFSKQYGEMFSLLKQLQDSYSDTSGYYILNECDQIDSLENFLRFCDNGDKFYLGRVYDYHF